MHLMARRLRPVGQAPIGILSSGCGIEVTSAGGATPRFSGEVKIGRRPSQDGRPYKRPPHHTFNRSIGDYGGSDG